MMAMSIMRLWTTIALYLSPLITSRYQCAYLLCVAPSEPVGILGPLDSARFLPRPPLAGLVTSNARGS